MKAFITGSGIYTPERVVSNEDLAEQLAISPEQIFKSSGIRAGFGWAEMLTCTAQAVAALQTYLLLPACGAGFAWDAALYHA